MDTGNRCGTCKHFGEPLTYTKYLDDGKAINVESKYRTCKRIEQIDELPKCTDAAYAIDGSDYFAALVVAEGFGCTLWEPKPEQPTSAAPSPP